MAGRVRQGCVVVLLVLLGLAARLYFREIPNFTPISAIAMFAGFYFAGRGIAILVPLLIMIASDMLLSGYEPALRVVVYGSLMAPVLLHRPVAWGMRRLTQVQPNGWLAGIAAIALCALASSVFFFLTTNLGTWAFTQWYAKDLVGIRNCMLAGLPFFRYTLAGDMTFCALLFGSYAMAAQLAWKTRESYALRS